MTAERDLLDLLEARMRDVPQLRPTVLGDVFAQTRIIPQRRRRWPLHISALKFAAAGAVVVLFGGFLLSGVLTAPQGNEMAPAAVTESPSPMTTEAFLSTMVTEEVEPGVLRVIEDGYRGLKHPGEGYPWDCERVIVGDSDQVWRTTTCWWLFRLGQEGEWDYDQELVDLGWARSDASLDGRLWAVAEGNARLFDDGGWVPDPRLGDRSGVGALAVQGDGTVWLISERGISRVGETSAGSSSWVDVWPGDTDCCWSLLSATDDGVVWLINPSADNPPFLFLRFDGTDWEVVPGPDGFDGESGNWSLPAGVSANGTVWTAGDDLAPHVSLARLDEEGWTIFTDADGVKPWGGQPAWWGVPMDTLWVAPDGSAWVNASVADIRAHANLGCDGLARFDGDSWQSFFSGNCISDLDFAPDGSVWVVVQDPDGGEVDTYVITPEAVTATE